MSAWAVVAIVAAIVALLAAAVACWAARIVFVQIANERAARGQEAIEQQQLQRRRQRVERYQISDQLLRRR